jgi:lysophospholipase L1-like esterase
VTGFRFDPVLHSPLATVGLVAGILGVWTCAYRPAVGQDEVAAASAAEAADGDAHAVGEASPAPRPSVASLVGPRMLRDPDPDEPFGLPIAIEGPRDAMASFHGALGRAARGEGQARILFYGASHVASDSFTGPLRRVLQRRYGDAGHGFVLPVHPWRSYRHADVEVDSNRSRWDALRIRANPSASDVDYYGLAGVAVETDRAGAYGEVRTTDRGPVGRTASSFEVFYLKQPGGGDFDVLLDGRRVQRVQTAAEAPTPGYATFRVEDRPHSLRIQVRGNGKVRLFGVALERERPGVVLDTVGINGARVRSHLFWEDSLYREHMVRRNPDLVVLAYGTNESGDDQPLEDYERELRQILERVRETVPKASCLLMGPSDRPVRVDDDVFEDRPRTAHINAIQSRAAPDAGCGYFDLLAFQGGPLSMVEWAAAEPPYGQPDHVHFTMRGYHRLWQVLHDALLEGVPARSEGGDSGVAVAEAEAAEQDL